MSGFKTFAPHLRRKPEDTSHLAVPEVSATDPAVSPKHSILTYLPQGTQVSEDQKTYMKRASKKVAQGPSARAPMLCKGIACPFIGYCEVAQSGIDLPIGRQCPIELFVIEDAKRSLIDAIQIDEKDPGSYFVVQICHELAIDAAVQSRILQNLGDDPQLVQKTFGGFDQEGNALEIQKLNPLVDLLIRTGNMKLKRLIQLLATPKSKSEAGRLGYDDPSSQAADAMARASKLKELAEGASYERNQAKIPEKVFITMGQPKEEVDPLDRLDQPLPGEG